jgi:ribonuclease P protein component
LWVVRLRSPFDKKLFPSAASDALRSTAGDELATVLADAARRVGA